MGEQLRPQDNEKMRDPELVRVQDFTETLLNNDISIRSVVPDIDFEEEDSVRSAMKRFLAYEYEGEPAIYLNPELGIKTGDAQLSFEPYQARGGKRTRHGVFFGTLSIGDETLNVAVKPHESNLENTTFQNFESAVGDYFKTYAVKELGIYSLTPAAILLGRNDDPKAYSMTVLKEGLTTFDSIDWSDFYPNMEKNPGMHQMWLNIAEQLAVFHDYSTGTGYKSHGDMAARNIATTPDEGEFFIDWESAAFHPKPPRDTEVSAAASYGDLSVLLESMCLPPHADIGGKAGIGIFYGKSGDWWQGFRDIFFDEYVGMRIALAEKENHKSAVMGQLEEEISWLANELEQDIEMQKQICANIPMRRS